MFMFFSKHLGSRLMEVCTIDLNPEPLNPILLTDILFLYNHLVLKSAPVFPHKLGLADYVIFHCF